MKQLLFFTVVLLICCSACKNSDSSNVKVKPTTEEQKLPEGNDFSLEDAANANNRFGLDLFLNKRKAGENLFISPYSISSALAMTFAGANGKTEAEMAKTMHWPANSKALHQALGEQIKTLDAESHKLFKLNIANRIYLNKGRSLFDEFSSLNEKVYGAGVEALDFGKTEDAANQINAWVSKKTHDMIPKLLKPEVLDGAELVLVNAIYFYGGWANPFKEEFTIKDSFYVTPEQPEMVEMMSRYWRHDDEELEEGFNYYEDAQFQVLELPYHEKKGSMIIFLPQKNDSSTYELDSLMEILTYEDVIGRINALEYFSGNLDLRLPKWEQRTSTMLKSNFEDLGMPTAFSDLAEFPRMTDEIKLKIAEVVHEAVIEVNEKGTKAAASTAVITKETTASPEEIREIQFFANRPFFYLIKDQKTNSFLFMGELHQPNP